MKILLLGGSVCTSYQKPNWEVHPVTLILEKAKDFGEVRQETDGTLSYRAKTGDDGSPWGKSAPIPTNRKILRRHRACNLPHI